MGNVTTYIRNGYGYSHSVFFNTHMNYVHKWYVFTKVKLMKIYIEQIFELILV